MSNNSPSNKETINQTIGCLVLLALISISIGIGYLTDPGWGWLVLGLGFVGLIATQFIED